MEPVPVCGFCDLDPELENQETQRRPISSHKTAFIITYYLLHDYIIIDYYYCSLLLFIIIDYYLQMITVDSPLL